MISPALRGEQLRIMMSFFTRPPFKKVFIMSLADIREDSYSGADDVSEIGHLVGFRYSGLKNCVLVAWGDVPYGQGYSYLGIVAFAIASICATTSSEKISSDSEIFFPNPTIKSSLQFKVPS